MKKVRILALFFALLLAVTVFAGCGKKDEGSANGNGESITVVADGESDFVFIKSETSPEAVSNAAVSIQKAYKNEYGVSIFIRPDTVERGEVATHEIIIGDADRPEVATAKELLASKADMHIKDFIICAVDGNIVIWCVKEDYYDDAAQYYIDNYVKMGKIPGDLVYVYKDETSYQTVKVNGNSNLYGYSIVRSAYDNSYLTQIEIDALHSSLLEKNGYFVPVVRDRDLEAGDKEIIIGGSDRDGQYSGDDRDHYDITVNGSKIYINGGSDYAVSVAVREFTKAINNGNVELNDGVFITGSYAQTVASYDSSTYYSLKWSDEFDGDAINENIWYVCKGNEMTSKAPDGKTVYRNNGKNVYVKDGKLYQIAQRDANGYYGGMLWTYKKMHMKYGYVEAKMLLPDGDGFWVAMWLQGYNWTEQATTSNTYHYAEFDIVECFGNASWATPSLHRWPTDLSIKDGLYKKAEDGHSQSKYQGDYAQNRATGCPDEGKFSDDFHVFGCMWTPEKISMTLDGKVYFEHDTTLDSIDQDAYNHELFLLLSFANYYASCPVTPNATDWEWENTNKFIVDYIRVFQNDNCELKMF